VEGLVSSAPTLSSKPPDSTKNSAPPALPEGFNIRDYVRDERSLRAILAILELTEELEKTEEACVEGEWHIEGEEITWLEE